ncbi:MAG: hypothetical protein QXQ88_01505 [archaeon]
MKKGQGAIEYLLTYGWAILVVIIVGIVLWRSGVFRTTGTGTAGFDKVRPLDYSFSGSTGTIVWQNLAGQAIRNLNITLSGDCVNSTGMSVTVGAGGTYTQGCTISPACSSGQGITVTATITYKSEAGLTKTESGTIYGKC